MFLVPPGSDVQAACEPIQTVLSRSEAEVLSIKAWDERRLAYEIAGQRRGLYILAYFKADPAKIGDIEHDSQLSEGILRVLITRKDALSDDEVNAVTPAGTRAAAQAEEEAAAAAVAADAPAQDAEAVAADAPADAAQPVTADVPAEAPTEPVAADAPAEAPVEAPAEAPVETPAETVQADAPTGQAEAPVVEGEQTEPQTDN